MLAAYAVSLMVGQRFYGPGEVLRVILGETVPGASFTVGELRLPRASMAVLAGASFGLGGITFQTMLRNPLASPDVIGISSGASAAAVVAIVILKLDETAVSLLAIIAALATAPVTYLLSFRDGVVGTRLILIGIGIAAMLDSVVAYVIVRAASWDLQTAMRWLTGSLNGATWDQVAAAGARRSPSACRCCSRRAATSSLMQLGDDAAVALGVRAERTRVLTHRRRGRR